MEKQPVRIIFYTFEQIPQIYHKFAEENKQSKKYDFFAATNLDELENILAPDYFGIVLFVIEKNPELVEMTVLLKKYVKQIKLGKLKLAGFNFSNHPKSLLILQKLGIRDVFKTDITLKTLEYKMQFWSKALLSQQEKELKFKDGQTSSETKGGGKKQTPQVLYKDELNFSSDCWLINEKTPPAHRMGHWIIELLGPSPYAGRWAKVEEHNEDGLLWQWVPIHIEYFPFIEHEGNWHFVGMQPQFIWKTNIWKFMSEKPQLFFQEPKKERVKRIYPEGNSLILHGDSKYALGKKALILKSCDPEILQATELADISKNEFAEENLEIKTTQELSGNSEEESELSGALKGTSEGTDHLDQFYKGKIAKGGKLFDDTDDEQSAHEGKIDQIDPFDIYKHEKTSKLQFDDETPTAMESKNSDFMKELLNKSKNKNDQIQFEDEGIPDSEMSNQLRKLEFEDELKKTTTSSTDKKTPFIQKNSKNSSPIDFENDDKTTSKDSNTSPPFNFNSKKNNDLEFNKANTPLPDLIKKGSVPNSISNNPKKNELDLENDSPLAFKDAKGFVPTTKDHKQSKQSEMDTKNSLPPKPEMTKQEQLNELFITKKKKAIELKVEDDEYTLNYGQKKSSLSPVSPLNKNKLKLDKNKNKKAGEDHRDSMNDLLKGKSNFQDNIENKNLTGEGQVDHLNDKQVGEVNWWESELGGNLNLSQINIKIFIRVKKEKEVLPFPVEGKLSDIIDNIFIVEAKKNLYQKWQEIQLEIKCRYGGIKVDSLLNGTIIEVNPTHEEWDSFEIELKEFSQDDIEQIIRFYKERQRNIALFFKESKGI